MASMSTFEDPSLFGEGVEITANCINPKKLCLTIQVVGNILTDISIVLNYQINVDGAIKYLGNPDYVGFDRAGGELIACRVYLVWNDKQLALESKIFDGIDAVEKNCYVIHDTGKISSTIIISEGWLMSPASIKVFRPSAVNTFYKFSGTSP
jgi:hypothetical protein